VISSSSIPLSFIQLKPDNRVIEKNWDRQMNEASEYAAQSMRVRLDGNNESNAVFIDDEDNAVEERSSVSQSLMNYLF